MSASQKLLRQLKTIGNGMSEANAKKLGISTSKLVSLGLATKNVKNEVSYIKVEGAPRWAAKYKFTRKKYGIEENTSSEVTYKLTSRGRTKIKYLSRSASEEPDEVVEEVEDDQE